MSVLNVSLLRVFSDTFHSVRERVKLLSLFVHNLRYLSEENVQVANALLYVANLLLTLDDKSFLEVDFVLRCKYNALFLLLQLL